MTAAIANLPMPLAALIEGLPAAAVWATPPALPDTRIPISRVTADSRRCGPGTLFAALHGNKVDGHDFIPDAISRGANVILTDTPEPLPADVTQIVARHPRRAYARLLTRLHGDPSKDIHVTGVTGTNGKTSVTYILQSILREAGHRTGRLGTVSNDLGEGDEFDASMTTPDPESLIQYFIQMRENGVRHAVMEVSSHALDQDRVSGIHISNGIFTNLTQDHLDYHRTMQKYAEAKARLFRQLRLGGTAIVNGDDAAAGVMAGATWGNVKTYGCLAHNGYRASGLHASSRGMAFTLALPGQRLRLTTPLVGEYNVYNAISAFAAAHAMGIDTAVIARALQTCTGAPGRLERVEASRGRLPFTVFVDYAHTPDALEKALTALRNINSGRLTVVFGAGGDRDRGKRPLMGGIAAHLADNVILTSDNPRSEDPEEILDQIAAGAMQAFVAEDTKAGHATRPIPAPAPSPALRVLPGGLPSNMRTTFQRITDREAAIATAIRDAQPGEIILIAGKGHETYQQIGSVTRDFDDRAVARHCLESRLIPHITRRVESNRNGATAAS